MGFRNGAYATVWEVTPVTPNVTRLRISVSRKDKHTGEYVQDFSGFVSCLGPSAATTAAGLNVKDRIKLGDTDVQTTYDKVKKKEYIDYKVFSLELANRDDNGGQNSNQSSAGAGKGYSAAPSYTYSDESADLIDLETDDDGLPF